MLYARSFPFNIGWWSFIFPLGVYTLSTYTLGEFIPSRFFKILGIVQMVLLVLLWFFVSWFTVRGVWSGEVWKAPWLGELDDGSQRLGRKRKREESDSC